MMHCHASIRRHLIVAITLIAATFGTASTTIPYRFLIRATGEFGEGPSWSAAVAY